MQFVIRTQGHTQYVDITDRIEDAVRKSGVRDGIVCAFVAGTTAGMVVMDDEEGLKCDFRRTLDRLAPEDGDYEHNSPGDPNGFAHIRSMLVGPSVSVPVVDGKAVLGQWQHVFVADFDWRPRERTITVTVAGA
jgi:secondary thiamine-phosphate synthase enzyme